MEQSCYVKVNRSIKNRGCTLTCSKYLFAFGIYEAAKNLVPKNRTRKLHS